MSTTGTTKMTNRARIVCIVFGLRARNDAKNVTEIPFSTHHATTVSVPVGLEGISTANRSHEML